MKYRHQIFLLLLVAATSCVPLKKSIYLQGDMARHLEEVEGSYKTDKADYLVKPNDLLYIRVTSLDDRSSAFLNNESGYNAMADKIGRASWREGERWR